jgi:ketopantoate reductase
VIADVQASAKIWESSGFKVTLFEDVQRMVWEKLIMNVTFSGTTCATGLTIGEVMADPNAWGVAVSYAKEAIAVADAIGVKMEGQPDRAHQGARQWRQAGRLSESRQRPVFPLQCGD